MIRLARKGGNVPAKQENPMYSRTPIYLAMAAHFLLLSSCGHANGEFVNGAVRQVTLDARARSLRMAAVSATEMQRKAAAYEALFLHVGRNGLGDLMSDPDAGLALQSAWEACKGDTQRPAPTQEHGIAPSKADQFCKVVSSRVRSPIPNWWAAALAGAKIRPGDYTYFAPQPGRDREPARQFEALHGVFSATSFEAGFPFELSYVPNGRSTASWVAKVWAAGRKMLIGQGHHYLDVGVSGGLIYVFGAESHGLYLEAIDLTDGQSVFRFCTCYWFEVAER